MPGPVGTGLAGAFLFALGACDSGSKEERWSKEGPPVEQVRQGPEFVKRFEDQLRRDDSIIFRSWNGKWIGTDCDTELQVLPGSKVKMIDYGVGVEAYRGSFRLDERGGVTLMLEGYGRAWPGMVLGGDSKSLVLSPVDSSQGFQMGNRGGATVSGRDGSYWPFRSIPIGERNRFHD